jgi:hypothetical protein
LHGPAVTAGNRREAVMADEPQEPVTGEPDPDSGAKKALQAERERARKAEAEAKAARDELAKLKADLEGGKSDAERMAMKVAELEQRANEADGRALRAEVAQAKGLTAAQARRLQGATNCCPRSSPPRARAMKAPRPPPDRPPAVPASSCAPRRCPGATTAASPTTVPSSSRPCRGADISRAVPAMVTGRGLSESETNHG